MKTTAAVALAIAVSASGCGQARQSTSTEGVPRTDGLVTTVVDGDSIHVILGSTTERLRLIGVDAPEVRHPDQPAECFGEEAALFTQRSLEGRSVRIEYDIERRDRFDRLLAYVFQGGRLFNETLVAEGFAFERSYPPNLAHQEELRRAEIEARRSRRGLWDACER
ncbi:MAG TPA: thermonuclease family protein [Actinomycetota bacterium]|nr:thermonuclease family protein [Actinomycetota bacterium]